MKGRTTIVIAHRMSTIENCDKIFVLETGKVAEEGGFDELKGKGGIFAKLSKNRNN
jgi:ABC-type multidrug transport system fused ATPase/permease subunit